jgi:hypothetical protein
MSDNLGEELENEAVDGAMNRLEEAESSCCQLSMLIETYPLPVLLQLTNEEVHEFGALNTLLMTIVLIICFVVAYLGKK